MEFLSLLLHIDEHLRNLMSAFGAGSYVLLFAIIFAETGLVVIPFLPGDSLLFAAGTLAGAGYLNIWVLIPVLLAAAIIGDSVNYAIGKRLGVRVFSKKNARWFKPEHLHQTQEFFAKHGGKTIILARFLPIIRTFAPFIAGVGKMRYRTFFLYNVTGAILWVFSLTLAGYFLGGIPVVKNNFEYVIFLIIAISIIPAVLEYIKYRRQGHSTKATSYKELQDTIEKVN